MSDVRLGLALGGGAARGIAHIELLHALDDLGIKPTRMSGTSMGALVGVGYASGLSAREVEDHARSVLSNKLDAARLAFSSGKGGVLDLLNFNPLTSPLIDGQQLVRLVLPKGIPDDLSKLKIPFTVVATDFYAMSEIAISEGDCVTAVASSIAIPGAISGPPGPATLIDGGCVNPVPLSHVQVGCNIVAAISVIGKPVQQRKSGARPADLLSGAMQIQQHAIATLQRKSLNCDIWLEPDVDGYRLHDFFRFEEILKSARPARDQFKRQLERLVKSQTKS